MMIHLHHCNNIKNEYYIYIYPAMNPNYEEIKNNSKFAEFIKEKLADFQFKEHIYKYTYLNIKIYSYQQICATKEDEQKSLYSTEEYKFFENLPNNTINSIIAFCYKNRLNQYYLANIYNKAILYYTMLIRAPVKKKTLKDKKTGKVISPDKVNMYISEVKKVFNLSSTDNPKDIVSESESDDEDTIE